MKFNTVMSPVNVVMLVKDRVRLTEQALRTLYENTPRDQFNLTIVDDGSDIETGLVVERYKQDNMRVVHFPESIGIVGFLRNVGAWASERYFGRGEFLYFSDNDVAFFSGWLDKMTEVLSCRDWISGNVKLLGGYRHPFHGVNGSWPQVELTDAVAGYSHLMRWSTWDKYGPYDQHAKGVCQSEDFAICQKIVKDGGKVGYIHPPVIANCGITNSEGKPAIGHEAFPRLPDLIYE